MMTPRIYIDTSVIGGYFDKEFREWTLHLFNEFVQGNYIAVFSDVTLDELELARDEVRQLINIIPDNNRELIYYDDEVTSLADAYVAEGVVTKKYYEDALHIAIATINHVDVLVSWNFKHIVNLNRIRYYNAINLKMGYSIIEIRSPRELLNIK